MPKTARSGALDVAQQPLDLGRREVGVDDQAGALAHQRLVAGGAQLRRSARRCGGPARPAPGGSARRVAGSQATTVSRWLVMPIASSSPPWMPASTIASTATRRRHLPDFSGVVLDPAGPREVLLELRVGAAGDLSARRRRRGRSSPSSPGRSRGSGSDSADDREQARGDTGSVLPRCQPAQPHPVHQRHDRARVAPGSGTSSISSAAAATPS